MKAAVVHRFGQPPQFIDRAAGGELRIGVEQVPLAEVADAWRRDQHGRRLVLLP